MTLRFCVHLLCCLWLSSSLAEAGVRVEVADGFDYPVGKPDAKKYYKARITLCEHPFMERTGMARVEIRIWTNFWSCANGVVTFAYDTRGGWGRVMIIRHAYCDPKTGKVAYVDSLYGHLRTMAVKVGDSCGTATVLWEITEECIPPIAL